MFQVCATSLFQNWFLSSFIYGAVWLGWKFSPCPSRWPILDSTLSYFTNPTSLGHQSAPPSSWKSTPLRTAFRAQQFDSTGDVWQNSHPSYSCFDGGTEFIEKNRVLRFILAFSWIASLNLRLELRSPKNFKALKSFETLTRWSASG